MAQWSAEINFLKIMAVLIKPLADKGCPGENPSKYNSCSQIQASCLYQCVQACIQSLQGNMHLGHFQVFFLRSDS